ncbi:hypothetical protein ACET3Z_025473 [Daucus carota]
MSPASDKSGSSVFETGKYTTALVKVEAETSCLGKNKASSLTVAPPKQLLIATPSDAEAGEFPVLLLLHGYLLYNSFYSQLMQHIASHGFIVIAPQLYTVAGPDTTEEINTTAAITKWLSEGLQGFLPSSVKANLRKLGLAGHSRGGKVAFALALKKSITSKFSAIIGIDPVDGTDKGKQTNPPVLTYVPRSFDLNMAALVIGSGLGEVKRNALFPPCAPSGVNHKDFYNECREPACYFVVEDYGHTDMLDDETPGIRGKASHCLCKNGESREPMRTFVGGIMVAFCNAYLKGDPSALTLIRDGDETLPVMLQTIEFLI